MQRVVRTYFSTLKIPYIGIRGGLKPWTGPVVRINPYFLALGIAPVIGVMLWPMSLLKMRISPK